MYMCVLFASISWLISDAVYDILEVLISNLNDKQLDIMEDLIVNQYGED